MGGRGWTQAGHRGEAGQQGLLWQLLRAIRPTDWWQSALHGAGAHVRHHAHPTTARRWGTHVPPWTPNHSVPLGLLFLIHCATMGTQPGGAAHVCTMRIQPQLLDPPCWLIWGRSLATFAWQQLWMMWFLRVPAHMQQQWGCAVRCLDGLPALQLP